MSRADWLLDGSESLLVATSSTDPAETLARLARSYGVSAVNAARYARELPVYDEPAERSARVAWRFASAALELDEQAALERRLRAWMGHADEQPR